MSDQQCRFILENADIRGEVVQLSDCYQQVLANNPLPPPIQRLLGEFLSAVSLLAATLKFEGILTLQARGSGPLEMIMAECDHQQQVRAIANVAEDANEAALADASLQQLIGDDGLLAIIIDPEVGERYQGIVPLDQPDLAGCIGHYFAQSEQINTQVWLASDGKLAGGFLLQALPQSEVATPEENQEHWHTARQLVATVKDEELLTLVPQELTYRLLNEFTVRMFDATPIRFHCSCSRARSAQALSALGEDDVRSMLAESPVIAIDCQFCHQHYEFDQNNLTELFPDTNHTLH
ncbi:Hsp33 family molecular chaperone HslO [Halioxenophilus aromaticivorans]|uniref:33 kDa chaperonin n=1 Tax=Halioxenophilus aromaticivorans TaxID=1306992 RepID=A0AAV3U243_9ALTE